MSYILDALKKSESERLRRDAPGFADLPERSQAAGTPRWIWLLAALLLVNAVVVAGLLLRGQAAPPREATVDALPTPAAVVTPGTAPLAREVPPPVLARDALPADDADPPAAGAADASGASTGAGESRAASSRPVPRPATPQPAASPPDSAAMSSAPTLMELRGNGTLSLPDLHLDIHVYSSEPDDRFVFVNMNKYRERDRLAEGPLVREIGPDGVILEYRGTVFLLPRE